jgi:hypothetical protein
MHIGFRTHKDMDEDMEAVDKNLITPPPMKTPDKPPKAPKRRRSFLVVGLATQKKQKATTNALCVT